MLAVTTAEFTAEGTGTFSSIGIFPSGDAHERLLGHSLLFCPKLPHAVYQLIGVRKIATRSYHPNGNDGAERVNHAMAQMLAMAVNDLQYNWDEQLLHIEFA